MKRFFYFFLFLISSLFGMVRAEVDVDSDDEYYEGLYWEGPGFYYGIWFDNEPEYIQWRHAHPHHYHNHHPHHPHHSHHSHRSQHHPHGGGGRDHGGGR